MALYALTDLGARTQDLLFELAMFGGLFQPDEEPRRPGNLRTIVVTLRTALQRVVTPNLKLNVELNVDGERFELSVNKGIVDMRAGAAGSPDAIMVTSYEPMIAASEGEMPMDKFIKKHVTITVKVPGKDRELMTLLGVAMTLFQEHK